MIKIIIGLFLLTLSSAAFSYQCPALKSEYGMSDIQVYNMHKSFQYGLPHDMGYSLAAISFAESSAGLFLINPNDPSAGHHHILVWHVLGRFGMERTPENINLGLEMLSSNFTLSAYMAVDVLGWWLNYHDGDWLSVWSSYSGGFYWHGDAGRIERAELYGNRIQELVRFMTVNCDWN